MAKAKLSSYIKELNGRSGRYIHYNVKGYQYVRSYAIPHNPRTAAQQKNRAAFAEAVKLWQELSPGEKMIYKKKALRKSCRGYNLFISMQMKGSYLEERLPVKNIQVKDSLYPHTDMIKVNSVSIPFLAGIDSLCCGKYRFLLKIPHEDAPRAA